MTKSYDVEQSANVLTLRFKPQTTGWQQYFLLRSDAHHDNAHANHDLELRHLKQARERNAGIFDFGDMFCAMQGKWDKRASGDAMRPELRDGPYLDQLVKYNAGFYRPYADLFELIQHGNHETSILARHETDLTAKLGDAIGVRAGGYVGWIRFMFQNAGKRKSLWMYRHHGYGGGGAVTKGVIQSNRMAVYTPDATFVVTGHTHDQWILPLQRTRVNDAGRTFQDTQHHIRCGGYKDEHSPMSGWWAERGGEPKPLGAVWLRFFLAEGDVNKCRISYELSPTYSVAE